MSVTFKKPPLNEVALGYSFLPRPDLLVPHLGRFWGEIADGYPKCQHANPIIDRPEADLTSDIPLPRLWFLSDDESRLIQLQRDRLIFNWRDLGKGGQYGRFPGVRSEFERVRQLFELYVEKATGQPIAAAAYSLTYVNIIKVANGSKSFEEVEKIFPDLVWRSRDRFLPLPLDFAWKRRFSMPEDFGMLGIEIQSAKLTKTGEPAIKFELTAKSTSLGGKDITFAEWVPVAHEWIVEAFKDLTSSTAHQELWELEREG